MIENDRFRYKWWALSGVCLLAFTGFMDATIVNTALPFIQTAFDADILHLQWVANIFSVILSMTMIAIGKIADIWGRKRIFYIGMVIFAIAACGAGLSPTLEVLVIFRALQALGAATIFVVSAALLSDVFPKNERVRAISIYGGITGFGLMIGPLLGGILIGLLGWRWIFWINLPLIAVGLGICSFSLRGESAENHALKIDWLSLALLVIGLGALMYGILEGAQAHWESVSAWIVFGIGVCALILLIIRDELCEEALLDLHIFKEKLIVLAALSCAFAGIVSTVFMFFDPLYLRILRQLSPFMIGLLIATIPASQALISLFFSRLVKWFGLAKLLLFSCIAAFLAVALHRMIQVHTPLLFLILPFVLLGINWGLSNAAMITAVNEVIASHEIGAALGTMTTIWSLIGSVILALSAAVFHSVEIHSSFLPAFHTAINFNIAFALLILTSALWVYIKLKRGKRSKN